MTVGHLETPRRGRGLNTPATGRVIAGPTWAESLSRRCPVASRTSLHHAPALAEAFGIEVVALKEKTERMGLGSFKALGASHAIARHAARKAPSNLAPSHLALAEPARSAGHFLTISDRQAAATVQLLASHGTLTTPSGAAGVSGLQHAGSLRAALGLSSGSRALAVITEGPEDAP